MGCKMRRLISFACEGETLIGTLDDADGPTGLLIVSGGNEIRCGAHRGMALLASRLAEDGFPVFRFDRRGIGDSSGENAGFTSSAADIAAASAAFRSQLPRLTRVIGFGNCDAATALAFFASDARIDRLVLANPWIVEPTNPLLPPAAAIRHHYRRRLMDLNFWRQFLRGRIDLSKSLKGLRSIVSARSQVSELTRRFMDAVIDKNAIVVLARGDATAIAYHDTVGDKAGPPITTIETSSHSFAGPGDLDHLQAILCSALTEHPTMSPPHSP